MNSLCDKKIIAALYEASCAGVEIQLIIRGICCLKAEFRDSVKISMCVPLWGIFWNTAESFIVIMMAGKIFTWEVPTGCLETLMSG